MLKRLGILTSLVVSLSIFSGTAVQASDFNIGALPNKQWTCIKNDTKNTGPISDMKVAELEMAPTSTKVKGSSTTFTYTKFKLNASRGNYTQVALSVFKPSKTLKQSFIDIKNINTEQKINFSVTVPTKEISKISLGITIQNLSDKSSLAGCMPNKVYQGLLPKTNFSTAQYAKEGGTCSISGELSFGVSAPLECSKGVWVSKNLAEDTVATRAYRSLIDRYNSMPATTPNLLLRIDPKAGKWKNDVAGGIIAGARLWGTSKDGDKPIPSYISETGEYVSAQLAADGIRENPEDAKRNRDAAARGGGQAGSHGQYFDFIFSNTSSNGYGFYQVGAHEYTHYAQQILSNGRNGAVEREFWIDEGCATLVGTGMGAVLGLPQDQRADVLETLKKIKDRQPLKFFSRGSQASYADPRINQVYEPGFFACEALVALKGIDGIEKVYRELSSPSANYDTAITAVYGVGLDSIIPFLQKYIDSIISGKPLSLQALEKMYSEIGGK
jgi:hypothetical protein